MRILHRVAMFSIIVGTISGCAVIKPYQREQLASPVMEDPFSDYDAPYRNKVVQTRTGGGLSGGAVGGGCGCTQ